MIVFGGWNGEVLDDLWALEIGDAPTWIHLDPPDPRPPPRYNATAIYDPVGDRVIVFGGLVEDPFQLFDDVWALELSGTPVWRELKPAGAGPAARMQHSAIYDSTGHRMIVFGGQAGQRQNDVWALDLEGEGAWSRVTTGGTPPSQRYGHSAVCDIARNRMIVFGGSTSQQIVGDLWSLDLGPNPTWSELDPMGSPPPPSRDHAAIYDPIRQRMAVFGGYPEGEELWFLEWSPLTAIDTPQPPETREGVSMPPPFPNPSRKGFTIRFSLPAAGAARVDVVDLAGRRVVRLADGRFSSGHHEIQWAGSDSRGIRVGAGVYFVTLRANDGVITRRITIF
jgi:hypothetical protein